MDWKQYIEENCRRPMQLDSMASDFGLSPETLRRRIRRQTGEPFKKIYLSAKMNKAAELIRACPDEPLVEIAEAVGIGDPFYFSRLFRKYMGMPPSRYREDGES